MLNQQIAQIFYRIAEFLEVKEVKFKPRAYEKVARVLESMSRDVEEIYKEGGIKALEEIPGVGVNITEKIEEFIKTGKIKDYEKLKKECPIDLEALSSIEGLGPKMIKALYKKLGVKNLHDLEKAAKAGRVKSLFRFGPKVEENILKGIEFVRRGIGRWPLGEILPLARDMEIRLQKLKAVDLVAIAGSLRRRRETIGDLDVLVSSDNSQEVMDFFINMLEVERVYARGDTKSSVLLKIGIDADMRVVDKKSFGSALQYFTGNKDHNIALRKIAIKNNLKLNEYGLFSLMGGREEYIAGKTENEIYETLGLAYIEPELRENTGEIESALRQEQGGTSNLPKIIGYNDIKGDLQMHSVWSDGANTIEEMAQRAIDMGYEYIAITDHSYRLKIANGLDKKRLLKQMEEIDTLNDSFGKQNKNFTILKGAEIDILPDGSLDIDDDILRKLDIVLGAVHSSFKMLKEKMTERICCAMKNPYVNIIAHPTGRVIQHREGYQVDLDKIFEVAKETRTALEINAHTSRLDLSDINIKKAVEAGVKMVISTDAHAKSQLLYMELGIAQARRGWAERDDILNTKPLKELLNNLKQ